MIDETLSKQLGYDAHGSFVKTIEVENFGKDFTITFLHAPYEGDKSYKIVLDDCRNIHWEVMVESFDPPGSESPWGSDVIGLHIGEDEYRKEFIVSTSEFELLILYKKIHIIVN